MFLLTQLLCFIDQNDDLGRADIFQVNRRAAIKLNGRL